MHARATVGILLLLVGAALLLDQLDVWDAGALFSTWWPTILVLVGVVQLATRAAPAFVSVLLILVGSILQADRLDLLPAPGARVLWPAIILLVGIWILLGTGRMPRRYARIRRERAPTGRTFDRFVLFGGLQLRPSGTPFARGEVTALFGGATIDLRDARPADDRIDLEVTAIFGGVEIVVPPDVAVELSGTPILGGIENQAPAPQGEPRYTVHVQASAVFGGVSVRGPK